MNFLYNVGYTPAGTTTPVTSSAFQAVVFSGTNVADLSSLANYLFLPLVAITFVVTVVMVGTMFFRRWVNKGVRGAAGLSRKHSRRRR